LISLVSCNIDNKSLNENIDVEGNVNKEGIPEIVFNETEHDFGRVIQGEKVGWFFKYRNEGDADLIISKASASCGCTVPDYDRKPLSPGEESKIKVVYDSSGRSGTELKTVTIESNTGKPVKLKLIVEVINN